MTQFNATTYHVERTTGQCAVTGRALQVGESYIATLLEIDPVKPGDPGLKRQDVSLDEWNKGFRPPRLFCHWRATVPEAHQKKRLFVDDQVLYNLLIRLADDTQPQRMAFRFVLALILMRKKLLRYDGVKQKPDAEGRNQPWWLVTPKVDLAKGPLGKWDETATMEVLDPRLDDQQVLQITEQLNEVLEAEL
ncbi:MAG: hypothetical protein IT440_08420 [Phycisphaeraceae bacterium]|nr:hypothetical protein [Phycisphaeraceae bacterium]